MNEFLVVVVVVLLMLVMTALSQISKVNIEKPLKEVYISSQLTRIELYTEYVKIETWNQDYPSLKPYFSFTLSLEDYRDLRDLVESGKEGDTYSLLGFEGEELTVFFTEHPLVSKPIMILSMGKKTVPWNIFIYKHYKNKFFSLIE